MSASVEWRNLLNLDRQYAFYAGYHRHPINKVIHIVCIPIIVISALVFLSFVKLPTPIFQNAAQVLLGMYALYYLALDFKVGIMTIPLLIFYGFMARLAIISFKTTRGLVMFGVALQLVGWSVQLFGHFFYERRSPALTESVVQAFLVAPLFVFLEPAIALGFFPGLENRLSNNQQEPSQKTD